MPAFKRAELQSFPHAPNPWRGIESGGP